MIFKTGKYKNNKLSLRVYRCPYPVSKPTKKFEAVFLQVGNRGYWIFRNKQIYQDWPCQA